VVPDDVVNGTGAVALDVTEGATIVDAGTVDEVVLVLGTACWSMLNMSLTSLLTSLCTVDAPVVALVAEAAASAFA